MLPGDRLIMVVDGRTVAGDDGEVEEETGPAEPSTWYEGLMDSLDVADGAPGG